MHARVSELVDEVVANVLLHGFFRHRGSPFVLGPGPSECPSLYCGDLAGFYAPQPVEIDLQSACTRVAGYGDHRIWDFRFASETVTRWPENNLVRGRHWQAGRNDAELTVVGVHGIVQVGHSWFDRLAERLNPHGIDLVMVDAPFNYRRTPAGYRPGQLILNGDLGHQLAVIRQGVLDVWRVILSLQQAGRRVGLLGISYGGWLSLLAALLAERLEFVLAVVPPVDVTRALSRGGTLVRASRRGLASYGRDFDELVRTARPIVPGQWQPRLPGQAIALHAARYDRFVSCNDIEDLSRKWGTRLIIHNDAHCRPAISAALIPQLADEIVGMRPEA